MALPLQVRLMSSTSVAVSWPLMSAKLSLAAVSLMALVWVPVATGASFTGVMPTFTTSVLAAPRLSVTITVKLSAPL